MKKIILGVFALTLIVFYSCNEESTSKIEAENLTTSSKNLQEFFANQGVEAYNTKFNAATQQEVVLPGGSIVKIPHGALTDGKNTYLGEVVIYSKELTSLADMVTSNYQTLDVSGTPLTTGGSFELLFFDTDFNKLGINEGEKIEVNFISKIINLDMNNMDYYQSIYVTNEDTGVSVIKWELKEKAVKYKKDSYSVVFDSNDPIGAARIDVNSDCWNTSCPCYLSTDCSERRAGLDPSNNVDIAPPGDWDDLEMEISLDNIEQLDPVQVGVYVIAPEFNSIVRLDYNRETNSFSTESGLYPNVGQIVLTAFTLNEGEFISTILRTDTNQQNYNLNLEAGDENEYNSILASYFN